MTSTERAVRKASTVGEAKLGDIVEFKSHAIRVEESPELRNGRVRLSGRENRDGCPYVRRWYFANLPCVIRNEEE